jgi:hypothetical protein
MMTNTRYSDDTKKLLVHQDKDISLLNTVVPFLSYNDKEKMLQSINSGLMAFSEMDKHQAELVTEDTPQLLNHAIRGSLFCGSLISCTSFYYISRTQNKKLKRYASYAAVSGASIAILSSILHIALFYSKVP